MNTLPHPGPSLAASTVPPCSSVIRRTSVSPRPRPPCPPAAPRAPCTKRSKTRDNTSGAMPIPESRTRSTASPSDGSSVMSTVPPAGVKRSALPTRLVTTCSHRVSSTSAHTGSSIRLTRCCSVRPLVVSVPTARRTASASSSGRRARTILPEVTRATSRRSSTRWARWAFWRAMISRARRVASAGACGTPSTWVALAMAASGLRSSWPSMARSSSLPRLAASASDRAACSASSNRAFCMATAVWSASLTSAASSSAENGRSVKLLA